MSTDAQIEQEIQDKGLTAPRVTPESIEALIVGEYFVQSSTDYNTGPKHTAEAAESLNLLTIYVLVLKNGFTVVGKSACASPENFDAELGRKIARADAINQVWPLEGYALKTALSTKE